MKKGFDFMKIYRNGEIIESKEIIYYDETEQLDNVLGMSNVRGCKVKVPHELPFSFYFSPRQSSHAIRVKVLFNPNKMIPDKLGVLELHGDWKYTPGSDDKKISKKMIQKMKQFFMDYKVLFAAVWELLLPEDVVEDYFRAIIDFSDLLAEFEFYEDYKQELNKIQSIKELESFVRKNNLFNMWD